MSHMNSSKQKIKKEGTVLWDEKGFILVNFVPRETTLNSSCYVAGLHGTEALHACCFEVSGVVGGERRAILTLNKKVIQEIAWWGGSLCKPG